MIANLYRNTVVSAAAKNIDLNLKNTTEPRAILNAIKPVPTETAPHR